MRRLVLAVLFVLLLTHNAQGQENTAFTPCEQWSVDVLSQLPAESLSAYLADWFDLTAEDLGMPSGCERPVLPPQTPWCLTDHQGNPYCIDDVQLVWESSTGGFCYWIDPAAYSVVEVESHWYCVAPPA